MNSLKRATIVTFVAGLGLFLATTSVAAAVNGTGQNGVKGQSGLLDRAAETGVQGQSGELDRNSNNQSGDQGTSGDGANDQSGVQGQSGELDRNANNQSGDQSTSGDGANDQSGDQGQSGQSGQSGS